MATDGSTLLTASVDTRAILWDLAGDRRLDRRFAVDRPSTSFANREESRSAPTGARWRSRTATGRST